MANYAPSTRERISDLVAGMRLQTDVFDCADYIDHDSTTTGQYELFNVYGRIMLLQLYIEAITVWGAGAAVISFTYTSSDPVVAVAEISDACASVATLAEGLRVVWVGGAVATAAVITASAGISDVICVNPIILGTQSGEGTIGMLTATAGLASGTAQAFMNYVPLERGAYVTANSAPTAP